MWVVYLNFIRSLNNLYKFCCSDEPGWVKGRAECEEQYKHNVAVAKEIWEDSKKPKPKKPTYEIPTPYLFLMIGIILAWLWWVGR